MSHNLLQGSAGVAIGASPAPTSKRVPAQTGVPSPRLKGARLPLPSPPGLYDRPMKLRVLVALLLASAGIAAAVALPSAAASSACASDWTGGIDGSGSFVYPFVVSGSTLTATVYARSAGCEVTLTASKAPTTSATMSAGAGAVSVSVALTCPSSGTASLSFGGQIVTSPVSCSAPPAAPKPAPAVPPLFPVATTTTQQTTTLPDDPAVTTEVPEVAPTPLPATIFPIQKVTEPLVKPNAKKVAKKPITKAKKTTAKAKRSVASRSAR